jgi:Sulfatase
MDRAATGRSVRRWAAPAAALLLLNASLTFVSVWPTLAVRPAFQLSLECAALVLALVLTAHLGVAITRTAQRALASLWVVLIVARYVDVSTRSLYGREFNLYWDLKLLPDVGAMFAYAAQPGVLLASSGALIVVPLVLYLPTRWAIGVVSRACGARGFRLAASIASLGLFLLAVGQQLDGAGFPRAPLAAPVSDVIAGEMAELAREVTGRNRRAVPPGPPMESDLAYVQGSDVVLLFVESYGVTSWERPEFSAALAPARAALAAAVAGTGRASVTATVQSTTFGGESWLAHISLLSGIEVRDPDMNRRLMAERRDTLVTAFSRRGYRTLAVMPGLHAPWPEGAFYGFDRVYGAPDLGYTGPPFGWWDVTDQFVLARMNDLALAPQPRPPVFVFLPTISTHVPFTPVPPYQPDWARLLTPVPYDEADLSLSYDAEPDWSNLGPGYARSLAYLHDTVSGYLRMQSGRDLVLVIVGDHQPPALVSGEGASWNVPVHVLSSRPALLARLRAQGFRDGLAPAGPPLARMDTLLPILLHAFGNAE